MSPDHPSSAESTSAARDTADFICAEVQRWQANGSLPGQVAQRLLEYHEPGKDDPSGRTCGEVADRLAASTCWSCQAPALPGDDHCVGCGAPLHTPAVTRLRLLRVLEREVHGHMEAGRVPLALGHRLLADCGGRIRALTKQLDGERLLAAEPAATKGHPPAGVSTAPPQSASGTAAARGRSVLEILLDPRSIQWLLASGGLLVVVGLVIYLVAAGFFQQPVRVAWTLGLGNAALLGAGWATILRSRYQLAGRALTLLACLVMPLHLWFYHSQGLITVAGGGLWVPALVICVLYALSAWVLRDPTFVYTLVGGVVLAGLLILADRNPERFWQITAPSMLLCGVGLACIHLERAFPPREGPFSREQFGLAFFWSGQVCLGAGLLLLLAAQLLGGPLYEPFFRPLYAQWEVVPAEVVATLHGRQIALVLILLGTYGYLYSALKARQQPAFLRAAAFTLLWAEVVAVSLVPWPLNHLEVLIIALAVTGLLANLVVRFAGKRPEVSAVGGGAVAVGLHLAAVLIGVFVYCHDVSGMWPQATESIGWGYVIGMALTALSCRLGAQWFRQPDWLRTGYHFGTGAALMVGAVGLLRLLHPDWLWHQRAPFVMLLPLAYLVASRLYRDAAVAGSLRAVAHTGTAVMLASSLATAFTGFVEVRQSPVNLALAVFFAEAAVFYVLDVAFNRHQLAVYGGTATGCAAVWQLLAWAGVAPEVYILAFAVVGLLLLVGYRLALLEGTAMTNLTPAAFACGNALLMVAAVAGGLKVFTNLAADVRLSVLHTAALPAGLAVAALAAAWLTAHRDWRRAYVATAAVHGGLTALVVAFVSNLSLMQKGELAFVLIGLLLLIAGHVGWYREQERADHTVSFALFLGAVLTALPLTFATLYCRFEARQFDAFHVLNEVGMLACGLLLLAAGAVCRIKGTTLTGAAMMAVWLLSLVAYLRLPEALQTTAVYLMVGGAVFFLTGLLLSVYRDRLLTLPDRIKRREGLFRVLAWR